jgi:hypothetical protein
MTAATSNTRDTHSRRATVLATGTVDMLTAGGYVHSTEVLPSSSKVGKLLLPSYYLCISVRAEFSSTVRSVCMYCTLYRTNRAGYKNLSLLVGLES